MFELLSGALRQLLKLGHPWGETGCLMAVDMKINLRFFSKRWNIMQLHALTVNVTIKICAFDCYIWDKADTAEQGVLLIKKQNVLCSVRSWLLHDNLYTDYETTIHIETILLKWVYYYVSKNIILKHISLQLELNTRGVCWVLPGRATCHVLSYLTHCAPGRDSGMVGRWPLSRTARSFENMLMAVRNYDTV